MSRPGVVLVVFAGCYTGPVEPARENLTVKPPVAEAPRVPDAICPDYTALRGALLRDAYPRTDVIHRCVPGRFPEPALFVVGSSKWSGGPAVLAIIDRNARDVIASVQTDCPSFEPLGEEDCKLEDVVVVDLDGDGRDELLVVTDADPRFDARRLAVYSVAENTLASRWSFDLTSTFAPYGYSACGYRYAIGERNARGKRMLKISPIYGDCKHCTIDVSRPTEC